MKPWEQYSSTDKKPWEQFTKAPESQIDVPDRQKEGLGRTVFDQAMQGATFGFADEVSDRIGALGASLLTDQSYSDLLGEARELTKERQQRQFEDRPGASIASNIAGGLLTGGAGATTKAGAAAGNFIRTGNTASRIGKGVAAGAASGAVYGAGTGEDGNRLSSAGQGAVLGGVAGGAIPAVGNALSRANTRVVMPGAEQVKKASRDFFKKATQHGADISADATDEIIKRANREVLTDQFAKDVIGGDEVSELVSRLSRKSGEPMSMETFEQLDKKLGDLAHRNFINAPDISRRYNNIQNSLRDVVEDPKYINGSNEGIEAFREGQRLWSVQAKMNDVSRIIEDSALFDVPSTAIKTGFRRIARDPKKMRGYTQQEQKAIRRAARTGSTEGLLKTLGSRLMTIAGFAKGGPAGAAVGHAISSAGREGAEAIKSSDANRISQMLATRSGMAEATKRIPMSKMKEIMKLPPVEARLILEKLNQQK